MGIIKAVIENNREIYYLDNGYRVVYEAIQGEVSNSINKGQANDDNWLIKHYDSSDNLTQVVEENRTKKSCNIKNYFDNKLLNEEDRLNEQLISFKKYGDGTVISSDDYEYYTNGRMKYHVHSYDLNGFEINKIESYDYDGKIIPTTDIFKDGQHIARIVDEYSGISNDEESGLLIYSDYGLAEISEDGSVSFVESSPDITNPLISEGTESRFNIDGTYTITHCRYESVGSEEDIRTVIGIEEGEYTRKNGHYSLFSNGEYYEFNSFGKLIKKTDNGVTYEYDMSKSSQKITKNGKTSYSKINHIEFDEETYNEIMHGLDSISLEYPVKISNKCKSCLDIINSFEDKFSPAGLASINNNSLASLKTIDELKESINYSLLAYQACDKENEEQLEILVDELFDESEAKLATIFKKNINEWIIDYDNDGIKEYIGDTNFDDIYYLFPFESYVDGDGNTWYLNCQKELISVTGENPRITFGGEEFNVKMTEDGFVKLLDSKGNPVNIFGDYNIDSIQYGGNQCIFGTHKYDLISDANIQRIIKKRFDECSSEELLNYFSVVAETGCGYVAMTNAVFKTFEGREEEFYKTFGYPMYKVHYYNDENADIDYNYEPMILDLYSEINGIDKTVITSRINGEGILREEMDKMYQYLNTEYDAFDIGYNDLVKNTGLFAAHGGVVYSLDNTQYQELTGHAMTKLGETEDGKFIVSTWGRKMIYDPDDLYDFCIQEENN